MYKRQVAAAAMIEDGLINSFNEPVSATICEWVNDSRKNRITIRHLLSLTSGLKENMKQLGGLEGRAEDKYAFAINLPAVSEPGRRFRYGPSHFYVFGEVMKRKLKSCGQTPLDYLKQRILDPLDIIIDNWIHDHAGNPHIPNGAYVAASDWAKFGLFLLRRGCSNGRQIIRADLLNECFKGSSANPGYGLAFWLNQPGGMGANKTQRAPKGSVAGWIYPDGYSELIGALGSGRTRMYIIPSRQLVIVRQAEKNKKDVFADSGFLKQILRRDTALTNLEMASEHYSGQNEESRIILSLDKTVVHPVRRGF